MEPATSAKTGKGPAGQILKAPSADLATIQSVDVEDSDIDSVDDEDLVQDAIRSPS